MFFIAIRIIILWSDPEPAGQRSAVDTREEMSILKEH
jgi:hypothetical protein